MSEHWYCLYTKPLKEAQVASYCVEQLGLETYFPRLRQQRTIRRQRRVVVGPLFPRYLFCRFDAASLFRAVRYAPDVTSVVTAGPAPAIVAGSLIDGLKLWAGNEVDVINLRPALQPGDDVQITAGPMEGLTGTILGNCEGRDRVTLLLRFLQCGAQLTLDRSDVRLIA